MAPLRLHNGWMLAASCALLAARAASAAAPLHPTRDRSNWSASDADGSHPCVEDQCSLYETLAGPPSPAAQPAWLANITQWRASTLAHYNYTPYVYDQYLPWTTTMFIAPQSMAQDSYLYDRDAGIWTVDKFLDDLETRT